MKEDFFRIYYIECDKVRPNPNQPRQVFDKEALSELAMSIKEFGVIQPLTVIDKGNYYELVSGERRLRASILAGNDYVPCILANFDDKDSALVAMIENLQRENLNFFEEAYGYASLIEEHKLSQEEVAQRVGKKQSTIANKLRILRLPEDIKKLIYDFELTERHARALLKIEDEKLMRSVLKEIIAKGYNVKKSEELIEKKLLKDKTDNIKANMKIRLGHSVVIKSIKNTYNAILDMGIEAKYQEEDMGEYVEVRIKVPKQIK